MPHGVPHLSGDGVRSLQDENVALRNQVEQLLSERSARGASPQQQGFGGGVPNSSGTGPSSSGVMSDLAAGAASGAASARQYLDIDDIRLPGDLDPKTAVVYVAQCQLAIGFVYLFTHPPLGFIMAITTCCFAGCGIAGAWLPNRKALLMGSVCGAGARLMGTCGHTREADKRAV